MQPKGLPDDPFHSISLHSPSDMPVHTDPKPAVSEIVGKKKQDKPLTVPAAALFVDLIELPCIPQQMALPESGHLTAIKRTAACGPWRGGR